MTARTGIAAGVVGLALSGALLVWVATASLGGGSGGGAGGGTPVPGPTPGPGNTPQYQPFTHAADYSWVAGRLSRSSLEGGFWVLNYLPEGAAPDQYRGRFVLGNPPQLAGFNDGELVVVFGRVGANQASIFMAGTVYELDRVQRL